MILDQEDDDTHPKVNAGTVTLPIEYDGTQILLNRVSKAEVERTFVEKSVLGPYYTVYTIQYTHVLSALPEVVARGEINLCSISEHPP